MMMGTGIVAVAARLLGRDALAWPLFAISLAAYPVLWVILLVRLVRFPRAVWADFASHERGPSFLTIVAANGVLGSQFAVFNILTFLLPALFWFSLVLWMVLVYGFLSTVTVSIACPSHRRAPVTRVHRPRFLPAWNNAVRVALGTNLLPLGVPPDASSRDGRAMVDQYGCSGHRHAGRCAADGAARQRPQSAAAATLRCALHRDVVGDQHVLDPAARDSVHLEGIAARSAGLRSGLVVGGVSARHVCRGNA
ncbi:MAG: hypothetical protein JO122_01385 [Acetobacteraceae bacterium]|nr:hypothetical protein [Acetobacteraceae bacterium]